MYVRCILFFVFYIEECLCTFVVGVQITWHLYFVFLIGNSMSLFVIVGVAGYRGDLGLRSFSVGYGKALIICIFRF